MTWSADDAQQEAIRESMRQYEERSMLVDENKLKEAGSSINVTLPNPVYDWLKEYSEELGISMSSIVRALITSHKIDTEEKRGK